MSKITLENVSSGYNLLRINANFQKVEDALNNNVLWRTSVTGEPNSLLDDLDVNSKRIYNLAAPVDLKDAARLIDVTNAIAGASQANLISFVPVGAGSTTRTVQAKLESVVDVKDFGAVGDGVTDDTAAFNLALLRHKKIKPSSGVYNISSTILMQQVGNEIDGSNGNVVINYTGSGVAIDFNSFYHGVVKNITILTPNSTKAIRVGDIAHFSKVIGCSIRGSSTGSETSGSVNTGVGIEIERSYYCEISGNDVSYFTVGIYGFRECNGNFIDKNTVRQCLTGILVSDTTSNSDGTTILSNEIESSNASTLYGIALIGADSMMVVGNRLEINAGVHLHVNSGVGVAQFNQLINNMCEGPAAGITLGDGTGSSLIVGTFISGGRAAGNVLINSDCLYTKFTAPPSSYGGTLTDNGYGSIVEIDSGSGKWYNKGSGTNTVKGWNLTVGGAATVLDTGTNYLQVNGNVGGHTVFSANGSLRVAQGSLVAGGDSGGTASCTTLSNAVNSAARSTGVGSLKFADTTSRTNLGFIKIYIGTVPYYVPYFDAG